MRLHFVRVPFAAFKFYRFRMSPYTRKRFLSGVSCRSRPVIHSVFFQHPLIGIDRAVDGDIDFGRCHNSGGVKNETRKMAIDAAMMNGSAMMNAVAVMSAASWVYVRADATKR